MATILQKESPILRQTAQEIPPETITSPKVRSLVLRMRKTLSDEPRGVALAAPQIGEPVRAFVVSGAVFAGDENTATPPDLVFINPELTERSPEKEWLEEGCLSCANLYGEVLRSKTVRIRAYDEEGAPFSMEGTGLLAQIFQHELDHLNGVLFTDTARNVRDAAPEAPNRKHSRFVFFGTPPFAVTVLDELEKAGFTPALVVTAPDKPRGRGLAVAAPPAKEWASARGIPTLQPTKLKKENLAGTLAARAPEGGWDVFVVAAYGKIIPAEIIDLPRRGTLNVHPSLLPKHRGASPIEAQILADNPTVGVTIMQIDEEMDHGPLIAQTEITLEAWPPYGRELESILAHEGGKLLAHVLPRWASGAVPAVPQEHDEATYCPLIKKEDVHIDLAEADRQGRARENFLKIRAYDRAPRAYAFIERGGKKIRCIITNADFERGTLTIKKIIPEGKRGMRYDDFLRA